ncbi:MAG: GNAT family N-acetyltransferase [Alphaproteobacteria bacterium]|nr:GNAT family N-acetyltransferase [Alphaproteobacteria bacterium]
MGLFDRTRLIKRGARVDLEIYDASHQERWVAVRSASRGFVAPWEPLWDADSHKPLAFRARLKMHQEEWKQKRGLGLLLVLNTEQDRPIVGGISISNIRYGVNMSASVGYWTGSVYIRQGYMFEGLNLALDFCFDVLRLRRIKAATLLNNDASISLLHKIGFQHEGVSREMLCINGRWQDHTRFALLYSDPRTRAT